MLHREFAIGGTPRDLVVEAGFYYEWTTLDRPLQD